MSPDGRTIADVAWDRDVQRLMVQDVAGGPSLEIARDASIQRPRWSPRGDRVAFTARDAEQKFAVRDVSRLGGPSRLAAPGMAYSAWSPDGSRMAVTTQASQSFRVIDTAGATVSTVPLSGFQWLHEMDWHLRSDRLAILEHSRQDRSVIWIATPDGKDVRPMDCCVDGPGSAHADRQDSNRWRRTDPTDLR